MTNIPIISLNGGVCTPQLDARDDLVKKKSMCRHLENMIPLIQGPVERRPGTKFIYKSVSPVGSNDNSIAQYTKVYTQLIIGTYFVTVTCDLCMATNSATVNNLPGPTAGFSAHPKVLTLSSLSLLFSPPTRYLFNYPLTSIAASLQNI